MKKIIWLASYPKSGNTWFRIFYTNLMANSDTPASINDLSATPIASSRFLFDHAAGVESSDLTIDEIYEMRSKVYEQVASEADATQFLKIHDAYTVTGRGSPLVSEKATLGALYFIRNPLDVVVSFAYHSSWSIDKTIKKINDPQYTFCKTTGSITNQLPQQLFTWSDHVLSWTELTEFPVHIMRYEDMVRNPLDCFTKAVQFAHLPNEPARIKKSLAFSHISELQQQEAEQAFREKSFKAESFFRKGEVGSWREVLTPRQVEKIIYDHARVMKRFGYLSHDDEPTC